MALSSAEPEYMAASLAACEAIWMRKILVGLFGLHLEPTVIYYDNQSYINSWLIQYFMIDPNTSTSGTIISEIVFSGESCYFHMFPRRIRMLTS